MELQFWNHHLETFQTFPRFFDSTDLELERGKKSEW